MFFGGKKKSSSFEMMVNYYQEHQYEIMMLTSVTIFITKIAARAAKSISGKKLVGSTYVDPTIISITTSKTCAVLNMAHHIFVTGNYCQYDVELYKMLVLAINSGDERQAEILTETWGLTH